MKLVDFESNVSLKKKTLPFMQDCQVRYDSVKHTNNQKKKIVQKIIRRYKTWMLTLLHDNV